MKVEKKDLETLTKVFGALSKAKWDGLDGNAIIEIHSCFVSLKKLEDRMKQELETPAPVSSQEPLVQKKKGK
jgi:hypothetical protein